MFWIGGPRWPWVLLDIGSAAVFVAAVVTAWRSADRVVPENRAWTRAWRIIVCCVGFAILGVFVPVGSVYVLRHYRRPVRRVRAA